MTGTAPANAAAFLPKLVFEDHFDGRALNPALWLPAYLPHWTSPGRAGASYEMGDSVLRLTIGADQPAWSPDREGDLRVSNVQTGHWSGPLGSELGQHRHQDGLTVQTYLPPRRLFTPTYGQLEMRARARLVPGTLAALWLIGYEDEPQRSGEITVMEVFAEDVGPQTFGLGQGIKAIRDPALDTEFHKTVVEGRLDDWHDYGMDWGPRGVRLFCDGRCLFQSDQSPDYPMQLMLTFTIFGASPSPARPGSRLT